MRDRSSALTASVECSITESQKRQRTLDCPGWKSSGAPQLGQRIERKGLASVILASSHGYQFSAGNRSVEQAGIISQATPHAAPSEVNPMPDSPAYLNPTLPLAERVQDLISRLTLDEKLAQLRNDAPAVPRLGLPAYNYWSEALHGVARNGRATVFPQAIGLAATWDVALVRRLASAIGDEGRAKYHETLRRQGQTGLCQGLTFWSPNVNIFRDPRWGRGQETYGEHPLLTGEIGAAFVRGLQGDDPRYLKAAACAKHFAVHSGPERLRHSFDAQVSLRDLHDTYLPAFKKLVTEAGVAAVMGAYNRVNGEPCCAQPYLVGQVLRQDWGFQGHLVSDCGAIGDIFSGHHSAADPAEAAALALRRGCDLECGDTFQHLGQALERGLVGQPEVDGALAHVLATRFRLGMFDPPEQVPYARTPMSVVGSG